MLLFVDQLTNVDFSYLDPTRGLLGETWLANIRLHGDLDNQSMVCDFGTVKKVVRNWLDTELDHRLAIPIQAPNIHIGADDDQLDITWTLDSGEHIHTHCPRQAVALIDAPEITPSSVAHWCEVQLKNAFAEDIERLDLSFSTEAIEGAAYHYSHGLKKHSGNCQRIAHGHRSRIDIWADGVKSNQLEAVWAARWRDIYIGTREDIAGELSINGTTYIDFAYVSEQGPFTLQLPKRFCYIIDTDTTVECLAEHIATVTARDHPSVELRVRAFEGINKGAEAYR
jgi:6-pyruvoyl-tetrahydropterin synthase